MDFHATEKPRLLAVHRRRSGEVNSGHLAPQSQVEDTLEKEEEMTERTEAILARTSGNWSGTNDSMPKSLSSGNQSFKPVKPENLVRPQGVKPPPPRRAK
jgi:hypothetical protein